MDIQRWSTLQGTFDHLADMLPADQERFLRALQEDDPLLATDVRELLEEDAAGRGLPEMNVEALLQDASRDDGAELPSEQRIGPYRILRLLGEGGMGVVYLAERTDIAGKVAIKLLRDAWLSPVRRQRFAIEQQMLGLLKHPSIARIYDAGTTTDGTPWFVMEYSDGIPVTTYAGEQAASARDTIKLVRDVCEAVRYAHSLAIIHRDLKPSNILVTADGKVKLLDFGIAKQMDVVNQSGAAITVGFRLFTPVYAAPELQIENKVGVFTDIFSMGVVLYQLLTETLPYPEEASFGREATWPSKVNASANSGKQLALSKSEWADVDRICMKALDREASQRYGSMDAMISDIDAFLDDRPIAARRNAVVYIARKFLSRNRVPVLSLLSGLLLVITSVVVFTVRLARARDAAGKARDQAVAEAARTARLEKFTESLFSGGASYGTPPPNIKVTEMLDRGKAEAEQLKGDPRLQANMFQTLGAAYYTLGHFAQAEPLLEAAQKQICKADPGISCADIELELGIAISQHGSPEVTIGLLEDALHIGEHLLPPDDPAIARFMTELAVQERGNGDYAGSKAMFDRALAVASASGKPTPQLAATLAAYSLGGLPYGDPRALAYLERSEQIDLKIYGRNSFEHASNELALGNIYHASGDYRKAEQHIRMALKEEEEWEGTDGTVVAVAMNDLAGDLVLEGKFDEAREWLDQSLAVSARSEIPPTQQIGESNFYLGFIDLQQGNLSEAERHFYTVLAISRNHEAVDRLFVEYSELSLAHLASKRGQNERAEAAIRQVLATTTLKPSYVIVGGYALLGHVLLQQGKLTDAEPVLRSAYAWLSRDAMRPHTTMTYEDYAEVEQRLGRPDQAAAILAALRARRRRAS